MLFILYISEPGSASFLLTLTVLQQHAWPFAMCGQCMGMGAGDTLPCVLTVREARVQVIQAMKPNALPPLADRYCTAINGLLRRELHAYTTELKRSAMARVAASPPEPDIVKGARKVRLPLLEHEAFPLTGASQHTDRFPAKQPAICD